MWRVFLLLQYISRISDNACSPSNEYPYQPRHLSELLWDSRIGWATVSGAPKLITTASMRRPYQPSEIPVTPKASRNAHLGSDSLLKLTPLSLHTASSHTPLEAPSDQITFRWCWSMPNHCNIVTDGDLNGIPNNCDMAPGLVSSRSKMTTEHTEQSTEWHHNRQSRKLPRDDHRHLTVIDITAKRLHTEIKPEDYQVRWGTKPLTETLPEWRTKRSKAIAEQHTRLNSEPPHQRPSKCLPRNQQIFQGIFQLGWAQGSGLRKHRSHHLNEIQGETAHRDSTKRHIKRCQNPWIHRTKRLSDSRCMLLSHWVWPPTVQLMC